MTLSNLHKVIKLLAIVLWLIAVVVIIVVIMNHNFRSLMLIIAYNHVQNYLGWIVVMALILSACGPILNLIVKYK